MAQTGGLKKKGAPPARSVTEDVAGADPRKAEGKNVPLQILIPEHVARDFRRQANERFDHRKGALSAMFLELWEAHNMKS